MAEINKQTILVGRLILNWDRNARLYSMSAPYKSIRLHSIRLGHPHSEKWKMITQRSPGEDAVFSVYCCKLTDQFMVYVLSSLLRSSKETLELIRLLLIAHLIPVRQPLYPVARGTVSQQILRHCHQHELCRNLQLLNSPGIINSV